MKQIGFAGIPGGGQIVIDGDYCYVGHIDPPHGTSILDISDPSNVRTLASIEVPRHTHSHKVRVRNGLMLVNSEGYPDKRVQPGFVGGLRIYDVSRPDRPREIGFYKTNGSGVHRFDFDGRYAYLSASVDGYLGNITLILDLADPTQPREVSRWWLPGQWTAGGETPAWKGTSHRTHHPLRFGDELYIGCCHGGLAVVDIADLQHPRTTTYVPSYFDLSTHTVLPLGGSRYPGRRFIAAVDEGWDKAGALWIVEATDPQTPKVVSHYTLPVVDGPGLWGGHQPHEAVIDDMLFIAWLSHGLRVVDVADPLAPREIGAYVPRPRTKEPVLSNDLFVDRKRGLVYLMDRTWGLEILEWSA